MTTAFPILFPTTLLVNDLDEDNISSILNLLAYKIEEEDRNFDKRSYPYGYTSFFTNQKLHTIDALRPLCLHIIEQARQYFHRWGYRTDQIPIAITSLWVSIQRKGAQHGLHNHRMSMFSGTYYSKATEKSANIMFQTPLEYHKMHMPIPVPTTDANQDDFMLPTKTGRMVLFPGYLNHKVMLHEDDEDRIAWSFNINYHNFFKQ